MRASCESGQRLGRLGTVAGLVQKPRSDGQRLVGAEAIGVGSQRARRQGLGAGKLDGSPSTEPPAAR